MLALAGMLGLCASQGLCAQDVPAQEIAAQEIAAQDIAARDMPSQGLSAQEGHGVAEASAPLAPELALMGTIPIYWGEAHSLDDLLSVDTHGHWARAVIERQFHLRPLDYLSAEALAGRERLLLAQPRGFAPEENVALDAWLRAGGRLLLFADPYMTGESHFALGDRRRPQDVALLSPILAHWGLELTYDSLQPDRVQARDFAGTALPVRLAGRFELTGEAPDCRVFAEGLLADCTFGAGRAVIVADAAMLDLVDPAAGSQAALEYLLGHVFGDQAGNAVQSARGGE